MAYTRVNWEDAPSEKTPINASNLNQMDQGIETLDKEKLAAESGDASNTIVIFDEAKELSTITSGAKASTLFGLIAKAIRSLISHLADTVGHITSTERTNWNDANSKKHSHSNKSVLDNTTASYTTAEQTKLSGIAAGAQKNTVTGIKGNAESSYRTGNVDLTPANIGAAASSHSHAASGVTAGTLAGKVQANASAMATLTNPQVRDIVVKTSVTEGGTATEPNGTIVFTKG